MKPLLDGLLSSWYKFLRYDVYLVTKHLHKILNYVFFKQQDYIVVK